MSRFDVVCVFLLKRMQHNHDPGKPGGEHNPLGSGFVPHTNLFNALAMLGIGLKSPGCSLRWTLSIW